LKTQRKARRGRAIEDVRGVTNSGISPVAEMWLITSPDDTREMENLGVTFYLPPLIDPPDARKYPNITKTPMRKSQ
jgi:Glu-tRNA(Gln) amidotransferase subunit E-like FAD-binding protein